MSEEREKKISRRPQIEIREVVERLFEDYGGAEDDQFGAYLAVVPRLGLRPGTIHNPWEEIDLGFEIEVRA